ncbi:MAG: hypothetical protein R6W70_07515, partial [bacterium]
VSCKTLPLGPPLFVKARGEDFNTLRHCVTPPFCRELVLKASEGKMKEGIMQACKKALRCKIPVETVSSITGLSVKKVLELEPSDSLIDAGEINHFVQVKGRGKSMPVCGRTASDIQSVVFFIQQDIFLVFFKNFDYL